MKFIVDDAVYEKFPGLVVGVVLVRGAKNSGSLPADLQSEHIKVCGEIQQKFVLETLSQEPPIQTWRKAYSAFGGKPKENKSSVESLYRQVLQGKSLRSINKVVDIYNYISLLHMLPAGGEDLDQVSGDIHLTFAGPAEPAVMLLGDREPRAPHAGEVIYKDSVSAICRRWNWREAERTKLTEQTSNCILVIEGLPPVGAAEVSAALNQLAELVTKCCGGTAETNLLHAGSGELGW